MVSNDLSGWAWRHSKWESNPGEVVLLLLEVRLWSSLGIQEGSAGKITVVLGSTEHLVPNSWVEAVNRYMCLDTKYFFQMSFFRSLFTISKWKLIHSLATWNRADWRTYVIEILNSSLKLKLGSSWLQRFVPYFPERLKTEDCIMSLHHFHWK